MKQYFRKHLSSLLIVSAYAIFAVLSFGNDWTVGIESLNNLGNSALEMFSLLPVMFILIGLFEVWVPRELVTKHTGDKAGIMSIFWLVLLAMLQVGPLYGAFPVAYALWRKGTSVRNVFIYLGAFSTMKLPMLSFEIGFLGLKFTLLRTALSLPVIILIAYIMDRMFAHKFSMESP
jgi:uncharacterized membrane protein YraQ (UPF0718 family)